MPSYAVACTLEIPVARREAREVSAIVTIEMTDDATVQTLTIDADGCCMLSMPTNYPIYLKPYVVYLPAPGATQVELDSELRTALGEQGWHVL